MRGQLPQRITDRKWVYTSAEAGREEAGFFNMEEYVRRRQNTAVHYISVQ